MLGAAVFVWVFFFFLQNGLLQGPLTQARITATNVTQRKYLIFKKIYNALRLDRGLS